MERIVWFIPLALLMLLATLLFRRHAYRSHRFFLAYTIFAVTADLARFATQTHPGPYYVAYYVTEAGYEILGVLVMYEVLHTVLGGVTRAWWARLVFPAILLAGVVSGLARMQAATGHFSSPLSFYILTGEVAVRFVQVFVFAGLVTLVPLVGLRWRQHSFGVATGFGLYATVMLLTTTAFSDFGTRFTFLWGVTSLVAYSFTVVIWIWFFSVPQKTEAPTPELSAPSPGDLNRYKEALRRMR